MGRASRAKRARHTGRTIQVVNDRTGQLETFHNVTVDDDAVADWLEDRWFSVGAGHPNRPPDWDTPTTRGWTRRPDDPPTRARPFVSSATVTVYRTAPYEIGFAVPRARAAEGSEPGFALGDAAFMRASAKAAIDRDGALFRVVARVELEHVGVIEEQVRRFPTEAEARTWAVSQLGEMSGQLVEELAVSTLDA